MVVMAIAARISMPMPGAPVPQSLQSLAVLLVGAFLGPILGVAAVVGYIAVGALGVPVFADGGAGWQHLAGPSHGYLIGFVMAVVVVGAVADRGGLRLLLPCFLWMLIGHAVILLAGWAGLLALAGGAEAWRSGVSPFIIGAMIKSAAAALLLAGLRQSRWYSRLSPSPPIN